MAKYTVKIKDIAENYYAKNIKEVQEIDRVDVTSTSPWENPFDTSYKSPFERKEFPDVDNLLENVYGYFFDFSFPLYDPESKKVVTDIQNAHTKEFCIKFLKYYYMREIGFETIGRFKLALNETLNRALPYFNQLMESEQMNIDNPLVNHDMTDEYTRENTGTGTGTSTGTNTSNSNVKTISQDTPTSKLGDEDYASGITTTDNTSEDNGTSETTSTSTNNETYNRHVVGLSNYSKQDMLEKYRSNILNVEEQIIFYCSNLFMNLW